MITNLYIDGFNLYYRALKDTPFRWLDLWKLAETLFPSDSIHRVCYFTARLDVRLCLVVVAGELSSTYQYLAVNQHRINARGPRCGGRG